MDTPQPADPKHDALVAELNALSRKYLLLFRVECGRTVAKHLFDGDPAVMRERLAHRDSGLKAFIAARPQELRDMGLSEALLRQSLAVWALVVTLPERVVDGLRLRHVVALTEVEDEQTRQFLAASSVENGWNGEKLIQAIEAVERGVWPDGQPTVPGLQPPEPPPRPAPPPPPDADNGTKPPSPGRIVQRFERTARDVAEVFGDFERVRVAEMSALQKERAREALGLVIERALALRERLQ